MTARSCFAAMLATVLLAAAAGAQPLPRNKRLTADIVRSVNTYPRFTVFDDVRFSVEDGLVTLDGKVTMPYKRDEIARRVSGIPGVREVVNRIDVLPVSVQDEALRRRIARAIYGHPSFWHYAAMANPPIHIVVERGHVTLTGVVQNNVERLLARSLAAGRGELAVTNELKTDAEMKSG